MDNFPEYIRESGPRVEWGWSSSAARSVFKFIKSQGKEIEDYGFLDTPGDMCYAALQIARDQGIYKGTWDCTYGLDRPWERAFTYGDVREAQWMAQIYLHMTREDLEADGFDFPRWEEAIPYQRVLIGAPLWIRTPSLEAITLYAGRDDLDHPVANPARLPIPGSRIMGKLGPKKKPSSPAVP